VKREPIALQERQARFYAKCGRLAYEYLDSTQARCRDTKQNCRDRATKSINI